MIARTYKEAALAGLDAANASVRSSTADLAAGTLLFIAITFNAALAIVNAQLFPLSPTMVIACEVLIVAAAHVVALTNFQARMTPWYALIGFLAAFALFRSVVLGEPDVKYLRDVLLIPTFIVLGMAFQRDRLPSLITALQLLVLAGLALEAFSLDTYADLFNIKSYYINTRGYTGAEFWNTNSTLFVSAARPDDRFFSFVDLHRLSSILLEPVSLGNYCVIITAYVLASYRNLTTMQRFILIGGTALLIIGCDGRLAAVSCLIIAIASLFAPVLPRRFSAVIPAAVVICALAAVAFLDLRAGEDNFSGRIAHTVSLLRHYGLREYLGLSDFYLSKAVDSGLAYLITTQSLFGTLVIWIWITLFTEERDREEMVFKIAAALYLSLAMLVSFSFLSIKTAAILWFIAGSLQSGPVTLPSIASLRRRPLPALPPREQQRFG